MLSCQDVIDLHAERLAPAAIVDRMEAEGLEPSAASCIQMADLPPEVKAAAAVPDEEVNDRTSLSTDCEILTAETVLVDSSAILIDGRAWSMDGLELEARQCGYTNTIAVMAEWRHHRKLAAYTCGIGMCCLWPAVLAAPVFAWMAHDDREQLVLALQADVQARGE